MRLKLLFLPLLLSAFLSSATRASTSLGPAPVLFFSDVISGPATGNSDPTFSTNGGAYVTLYGNFLGISPSVTLNGASCLNIVSQPATWLWYQRMIVQIGSTCTTGNFVVTTSAGTSNGILFTVVSGHTYYVSTTGNDSTGTGSFQAPWATPQHTKFQMADGDISYLENGVASATLDPDGNAGVITLGPTSCASTTSAQRAMGVYPGATATLGNTSINFQSIKVQDPCNGYTFFGLTLRTGQSSNLSASAYTVPIINIRYVALDVSCPNGNGATGCVGDGGQNQATAIRQMTLYGNNIHDVGTGSNALYQAVYHGTTFSVRDAWNAIYNATGACRGIQIFSSDPTFVHTDIHIHDNLIHDTGCNAIGLYAPDPSVAGAAYGGGDEIYNNVLYNTGVTAPAQSSGILISEGSNPGGGTVQIFNNTFYNCIDTSCIYMNNYDPTPIIHVHLYNNIMYQLNASIPYFAESSGLLSLVTGDNNVLFGAGSSTPGCGTCNGSIFADPGFVNPSGGDFHLSASTSLANGTGSTAAAVPTYDADGLVRPSPPSIGAHEFAAGAVVVKPNPPTNLKAVVQ